MYKKFLVIITIMVAIIFLLTTIKNIHDKKYDRKYYNEGAGKVNNDLSFEQINDVLREIGIIDIQKEKIEQLQEHYNSIPIDYRIDKMLFILSNIGHGDYNFETGEWKSTSKYIYSFDAEAYDLNKMYTLLFDGISSITNGEVVFSNIVEDSQNAYYENNDDIQKIFFELNGEKYAYDAIVNDDWIDIRLLNYVNRILEEQNYSKQFYFMSDGYQDCIIFYCNKNWADLFKEKTGYTLVNDIYRVG